MILDSIKDIFQPVSCRLYSVSVLLLFTRSKILRVSFMIFVLVRRFFLLIFLIYVIYICVHLIEWIPNNEQPTQPILRRLILHYLSNLAAEKFLMLKLLLLDEEVCF